MDVPLPHRPRSLVLAVACWSVAIAAGALETVLAATHALATRELPPAAVLTQVLVRCVVFGLAGWSTWRLLRGGSIARILLTVMLSGVGLLSLLVGPVAWLLDGHTPADALGHLDAYGAAFGSSRVVHVLAVIIATVLMYRPATSRYLGAPRPS